MVKYQRSGSRQGFRWLLWPLNGSTEMLDAFRYQGTFLLLTLIVLCTLSRPANAQIQLGTKLQNPVRPASAEKKIPLPDFNGYHAPIS